MELTKCIVAEFIECYKNNPTLWNINAEDYQHKDKKKRSYQELLKVYRKLNPDATVLDVKKKINTLRSSYRRESRKVQESEQAQDDEEEEGQVSKCGDSVGYQPKVWWYELMHFIGNMEHKYQRLSTEDLSMDDDATNTTSTTTITSFQIQKRGAQTEADSDYQENEEDAGIDYEYCLEDEEWLPPPKSKKQCLQKLPRLSPVALNSAKLTKSSTDTHAQDDLFDHITKTWASKLRSLPHKQRLFTERAINEILFQAEVDTLPGTSIKMPNAEATAVKMANTNGHFGTAAIVIETKPPSKLRSFFENV